MRTVTGLEQYPLSELGFRPGVLGPQPLMAVPDCCFASKKPCSPSYLLLCPSQKWGLELSCTWENDGTKVRVCCDTVLCVVCCVPMTKVTRTIGVQRSWPREPRGLQEWPCRPPLLLTGLGHFFLLPSQQCPNCLLEATLVALGKPL